MNKINKYLFPGLLVLLVITFFTRNSVRGAGRIDPAVLKPPLQESLVDQELIEFAKDGYEYELTPLFSYSINGLLVSKMNYRLFSLHKYDNLFPLDICLIWGGNVEKKIHKNKRVKFSQDCRWCWVKWRGNVDFNFSEIANSHLLIKDKRLERKIKKLVAGDQVNIKGKLVNVKAQLVGKADKWEPQTFSWNSSTNRTDQGAGACEVIYVEDVQVLKRANLLSRYLFSLSFYGLVVLIVLNLIRFSRPIVSA